MPIIRWGHETEIVDIEWLWKPFLPFGKVSIIEGDGGDGKTTMILRFFRWTWSSPCSEIKC